jgi:Carboxypeptidase regulatory-like domain/TonB dependent receptor
MKSSKILGMALFLVVATLSLLAQTTNGRILGTVHDQSGAAVASATVTVTDVQRGATRKLTTDGSGNFVASALPPSIYTVRAEANGFKAVEHQNVQLEVAQNVSLDFSLSPGTVQQQVVVTSEVPMVNTSSATLGGTLSNEEINNLPLNGRNYENLLQLRPGVMRYPGGGFSTTSADGLRAEDNVYLIDGLYDSEPFSGQSIINGAGIAGDSATILPVDSIQEFNVQQNPPAEYGWKPGATINVGVKSGTNDFHGTAYAFGRDAAWDARNYFNTVQSGPKTPTTLEQFGGTLGGPIVKDKLFFFGGYEGQRYDVGNSFLIQSPATVTLGGDPTNSIPDAITALQGMGIRISPASLKIAGCTLGPPVTCNGSGFPTNNGTNPQGPTTVVNGFPNSVSADNAIAKINYQLNSRNSINGMYFFGNNNGTVEDFPELQPTWQTLIHTRAQVAGVSWIWLPSSNWANEARFGYNRLYQPTYNGDHTVNPENAYGLNTGVATTPLSGGLPRIGFFGEFQTLGGFKWPKVQGPDTRFQFIDHVSYTRGVHTMKFGIEIHRDTFSGGALGNAKGSINFGGGGAFATSTALEDFFAGVPTNESVLAGNPIRNIHNWAFAGFVQDDWRVARNLTLNLGLRYELNTVIKDSDNLLGNFDPNLGLVQVGKQISSPYQGNHANFAPRVGFAWDIFGDGNTVLRGGAGLMYEAVNWETFLAFNNSFGLPSIPTGATLSGVPGPGTIQVGNLTPPPPAQWDTGPVFGNLSPSSISCADPATGGSPCAIMGVNPKITTPYVTQWAVSFQQALGRSATLEVAYVGNHGSNLIGIRDINQPPMGSNILPSCATDPNCEQHARPFAGKFPYLSNIFQMDNIYRSNYNGLQATLTTRNYHGLSMIAGYTWSHALDDVAANWDFGYGYGLPVDSRNPGAEYASSDFDIRNRFTLLITYALPGKKSFAQLLEGWQINSIVTVSSPQPWGPIDLGTDVSGTGSLPVSPPAFSPNRWDLFGNPGDFTSTPVGIPFFPGTSNPACAAKALALDGGTPGNAMASLSSFGCYAAGGSIMIPPPLGQFGTMRRNVFRDTGFRDWDFSVAKNWKLGERLAAQFRAEFFNILNHPNFANPYGGQNGYGLNDPSVQPFGCGCATPDVAAANPVIGSGGSRAVQLGLKFTF